MENAKSGGENLCAYVVVHVGEKCFQKHDTKRLRVHLEFYIYTFSIRTVFTRMNMKFNSKRRNDRNGKTLMVPEDRSRFMGIFL